MTVALFYLFAAVSLLRMICPEKYGKLVFVLTVLSAVAVVSSSAAPLDFSLPEIEWQKREISSELMYALPVRETAYRLFYEKTGEYPKNVEAELSVSGENVTIEKITVYSDTRSVGALEYLCEQLNTDKIYYGDDR